MDIKIRRGYPYSCSFSGGAVKVTLAGDGYVARAFDVPLELTAGDTEAMPAGRMAWETEDKDGKFVAEGVFKVVRTAKADGEEPRVRPWQERAIERIDELMVDMSGDASLNFSVGDKNFSFNNHSEMLRYRGMLALQLERINGFNPNIKLRRGRWPGTGSYHPPYTTG